jgi:hypothetical protein
MKDVRKIGILAFLGHGRTRLFGSAARLFAFAIVLYVLVLMPSGCASQFGETKAEARRRHIRNDRIRAQGLKADIDALMMWDEPTALTEHRIP